jgi:hypothetical protein
MLTPLIYACGNSEEEEQKEVTQTEADPTPAPVENTIQTNIEKQEKIEQEATNSLVSATVEKGFGFETQRAINIDLHFTTTQFQENISIYSTIAAKPGMPINLLEQGTIIQSNRYKSMLTAPMPIESFMVVRNNNLSKAVTLTINNDALLTHTFLE